MRLRHIGPTLVAALGAAATLPAQIAPAEPSVVQAISVNPLGLPFDIVSGEYERAVGGGATVGLGANRVGFFGAADYLSTDAKLRYYPGEHALRGWSLGASVGASRLSGGGEAVSGVTVGALLDHNWLLGRRRRFFVGTGVGAKRIFVDDRRLGVDASVAYPTARLQVGHAF